MRLLKQLSTLLCYSTFFYALAAKAIPIGPENYFEQSSYLAMLENNSSHPLFGRQEIIEKSLNATVLVPKRGTAVLISPDGLLLTAGHVISHLHIGSTNNCPKLKFHMFHRRNQQDQRLKEKILECAAVLFYDFNKDLALIKVKLPENIKALPFATLAEWTPSLTLEDTYAFIIGHPGASSYDSSLAKISEGPIIFDGSLNSDASHFLHWIDTEGGHSGAPVFNQFGEVLGVHSRGIYHFSDGVRGTLHGQSQIFKTFNLAMRWVGPLPLSN